jgi:hypothetical protein
MKYLRFDAQLLAENFVAQLLICEHSLTASAMARTDFSMTASR